MLAALARVRSLRFEAQSAAATGWDGVGNGRVLVSEPTPGVVVFHETGSWQAADPSKAPAFFRNVFRWSAAGDALRLEHLRFGPDRPVLLFDMAPGTDGVWREIQAHQCVDDRYSASLSLAPDALVVAWSIVGPRKQESIRYTYT